MLETFGTIVSILGGVNTALDTYRKVNTLFNGDGTDRVLNELQGLRKDVTKLNEQIFYVPGLRGVSTKAGTTGTIIDPRAALTLLEPVQRILGGNIVASELVDTPRAMEQALSADPWAALIDIRPVNLAVRHGNPEMVPVMFVHDGKDYVGWQMRGILPVMFNCQFHDFPGHESSSISSRHGTESVRILQPQTSFVNNQARDGDLTHDVEDEESDWNKLNNWGKLNWVWDDVTGRLELLIVEQVTDGRRLGKYNRIPRTDYHDVVVALWNDDFIDDENLYDALVEVNELFLSWRSRNKSTPDDVAERAGELWDDFQMFLPDFDQDEDAE
jgi:hypothetical protein